MLSTSTYFSEENNLNLNFGRSLERGNIYLGEALQAVCSGFLWNKADFALFLVGRETTMGWRPLQPGGRIPVVPLKALTGT